MNCMAFAHRCNPKEAMPHLRNGSITHYAHKTELINKLDAPLKTADDISQFLENFARQFEEENLFGSFLFDVAMDFLVIRLFLIPKSGSQGVKDDGNGTTRAGFSLKGQNLFYTLNGKEIHCGKVNLKNLMLKK